MCPRREHDEARAGDARGEHVVVLAEEDRVFLAATTSVGHAIRPRPIGVSCARSAST